MATSGEVVVGWGTLAMIISGIAQGKGRDGFFWFLLGGLFGPVALFVLLLCSRLSDRIPVNDEVKEKVAE